MDKEVALTLPLDVVERLLALAMTCDTAFDGYADDADREAIKTAEREVEQVRKMASAG